MVRILGIDPGSQRTGVGIVDADAGGRATPVFHDALFLYLSGAVRCPSLPALLAAFAASEGDSRP